MADTDHDGTGFFPRLVYLPGCKRGDPQFQRLFKSLGKDLDKATEDALCGTVLQPFAAPRQQRRGKDNHPQRRRNDHNRRNSVVMINCK
ncbi:MAG: hypothetical protein F4129_13965 [Acidimicrobiia bacterium]|nr:hypothetical protein [Acidimicrobiia bacterium]